jgi:hypothetical protein
VPQRYNSPCPPRPHQSECNPRKRHSARGDRGRRVGGPLPSRGRVAVVAVIKVVMDHRIRRPAAGDSRRSRHRRPHRMATRRLTPPPRHTRASHHAPRRCTPKPRNDPELVGEGPTLGRNPQRPETPTGFANHPLPGIFRPGANERSHVSSRNTIRYSSILGILSDRKEGS